MEQVVKRDGRIVAFDPSKIVDAVLAAMTETNAVDIKLANQIAEEIDLIPNRLSVEAIQDMVEEKLMASDYKETAKHYILYRAERTKQRNLRNEIMKKVLEKTLGEATENANANVDERSFGGRTNEAATVIQKWLQNSQLRRPSSV